MRIAIALTMALLAGGAHAQDRSIDLRRTPPKVTGHDDPKTGTCLPLGAWCETKKSPRTIYEQAGAAKGAIRGIMQNEDVRLCSAQGWVGSDKCNVTARAVLMVLVMRCAEYGECPVLPVFTIDPDIPVLGH